MIDQVPPESGRSTNLQRENRADAEKVKIPKDLAQYFGKKSIIEQFANGKEVEYQVSGILEDGMMEGGQSFSLVVKEVVLEDKRGRIPVWQLNQIEVSGVDVSSDLTGSVYIPRRHVKPVNPDKLATFDHFIDQAYADSSAKLNEILLSEFSSIDNFAALLHEDGHLKIEPKMNPSELDQLRQFWRIVTSIMNTEEPGKAAQAVRITAEKGRFLENLKDWARANLRNEIAANQYVIDYLQSKKQVEWFKADTDYHRVVKTLTTVSLTYVSRSNLILGEGTVDPNTIKFNLIGQDENKNKT